MPFWTKYTLDPTGAINNCIGNDGKILSKNRLFWSQGRALWTFSALYNYIEQRKEWLDAADGLYNYISNNGFDQNGRYYFMTNEKGEVIEGTTSIYTDAFILNGMAEYYKATGEEGAKRTAERLFYDTWARIQKPGTYGVSPFSIPDGLKLHGVNMVFSITYYNAAEILKNSEMKAAGLELAGEILVNYYNGQRDALMEYAVTDASKVNNNDINFKECNIGHGIECMWFLMSIFEREKELQPLKKCAQIIKRCFELGWDNKYGGIRLSIEMPGPGPEPDYTKGNDCKGSWIHAEALVASLYSYLITGDAVFIDWHKKIQEYTYSKFPLEMEWRNWIDREGNKEIQSAGLPAKDMFHIPRALINSYLLCKRLSTGKNCSIL